MGNPKKRFWTRGKIINLLIACAVVLLGVSMLGSTRAALMYFNDYYYAEINVKSIGVTLVENGENVSWRDYTHKDDKWNEQTGALLADMLTDAGDDQVVPGKAYPEELSVKNSGTIDEYVRVSIYRYWEDEDGKRTDLSPELIDLNLVNTESWIEDTTAATAERTVLYYKNILQSGDTAELFADTITIRDGVALKVSEETTTDEDGYTTITTTYSYDGLKFVLEADVDAVQTHNAEDAIGSAWGIAVEVAEDGSIRLK